MGGADDTEVGDIVEVDGEGEIMIEEGVADVVRDVLVALGDAVEDEAAIRDVVGDMLAGGDAVEDVGKDVCIRDSVVNVVVAGDMVEDVLEPWGDAVEDAEEDVLKEGAGTIVVISGTIVVVQEIIESSRTA